LSKNSNPFIEFITPVEKVAYENFNFGWMPCDLFLATCFIMPQIIKKIEEHHVTIELSGIHTRGMMVIDHLKTAKPNAHIIKEMDVEMFKKFILWVCDHDIEFP
jgi:purine nucleosidase